MTVPAHLSTICPYRPDTADDLRASRTRNQITDRPTVARLPIAVDRLMVRGPARVPLSGSPSRVVPVFAGCENRPVRYRPGRRSSHVFKGSGEVLQPLQVAEPHASRHRVDSMDRSLIHREQSHRQHDVASLSKRPLGSYSPFPPRFYESKSTTHPPPLSSV